MTGRRTWAIVNAIVLCSITAVAVMLVRGHNAEQRRLAREAGYAAVVADYANRLKPGVTRGQVEQQLQAEGKEFHHMCCMGAQHEAFDTLLKIGEESAPWYCSEHDVYVGFEFIGEETSRPWDARGSDKLVDVRLYKQISGCL